LFETPPMYQNSNIFEIVKISLPLLLVVAGSLLMIRTFLHEEQDKRNAELRSRTAGTLFPLRLNAYERLVLFIERCNPSNLLLRSYEPGLSARDLQRKALEEIRTEYEHNQTQQLYVTDNAWELVKRIRDETRLLINEQMSMLHEEAGGAELSRRIIEKQSAMDPDPYTFAISSLKSEVRAFY